MFFAHRGRGVMKVKIEIDEALEEDEVIIRCKELDDSIISLQSYIAGKSDVKQCISLYKGETEYYVPVKDVYFFETDGRDITAHTADKIFTAAFKLYELEALLPGGFMRISKSTIVNLDHIYSLTRNLTASSAVEFAGSSKRVMVSRGYYKALIESLRVRRLGRLKG